MAVSEIQPRNISQGILAGISLKYWRFFIKKYADQISKNTDRAELMLNSNARMEKRLKSRQKSKAGRAAKRIKTKYSPKTFCKIIKATSKSASISSPASAFIKVKIAAPIISMALKENRFR